MTEFERKKRSRGEYKFWVGLSKRYTASWQWLGQKNSGVQFWANNEPYSGNKCAALDTSKQYYLTSGPCSMLRHRFICEKDATSAPDEINPESPARTPGESSSSLQTTVDKNIDAKLKGYRKQ